MPAFDPSKEIEGEVASWTASGQASSRQMLNWRLLGTKESLRFKMSSRGQLGGSESHRQNDGRFDGKARRPLRRPPDPRPGTGGSVTIQ